MNHHQNNSSNRSDILKFRIGDNIKPVSDRKINELISGLENTELVGSFTQDDDIPLSLPFHTGSTPLKIFRFEDLTDDPTTGG